MNEMEKFKTNLMGFLLPHLKNSDPMMIAGVLMKTTMEIYTYHLSEKDVYQLLNVVVESVPVIQESLNNNTIH